MEKTAMEYHIDRLEHYRYLIENPKLGIPVSPEYLMSYCITSAKALLKHEKKQMVDFAYRAVNNWSAHRISREDVEKLYSKPKEYKEAILFTGTVESANEVIMFTEGQATYNQTKETIETQKVAFVHLFNGSRVAKDQYVIKNLFDIETPKLVFSVGEKDLFESMYEVRPVDLTRK